MKRNWKSLMVSGTVLTVLAGALTLPALASVGQRTAALHYQNIKVTLDGRTLDLTDSRGNEVEPFTIDGTTYLPVRAVANALDMDVSWNGSTRTVTLTDKTTSTTSRPSADDGDYIGEAKAKEIALDHAGLSSSQVTFVRAKLDWDDGRAEYEVEFYTNGKEYDYEIDALTGDIRSYDYDAEYYAPSTSRDDLIGESKAKAIVQDRAGSTSGTFREFKLDWDDGRAKYEGEYRVGYTEYDFEIDAATGTVLEWDVD